MIILPLETLCLHDPGYLDHIHWATIEDILRMSTEIFVDRAQRDR